MAIHRTEVPEVQRLEEVALLQDRALDGVLDLLGNGLGIGPKLADASQQFPHLVLHLVVSVGGRDVGQILFQGPHVGVDRHAVVVEDDQHVGVLHASLVEALEGQTAGHGPIADDGHMLDVALAVVAAADSHAECRTDTRAAVPDPKRVVFAFAALGEAADAFVLTVGVETLASTGQNLVAVGLVSDVPHDLVLGGVEDVMQGHGKLDDAKAGAKVPTFFRHHIDDELTQLIADLLQFLGLEFGPQVRRKFDLRKKGAGSVSIHGSEIQGWRDVTNLTP